MEVIKTATYKAVVANKKINTSQIKRIVCEGDVIDSVVFVVPRYEGSKDMSVYDHYLTYSNSAGEGEPFLLTMSAETSTLELTWNVSRAFTAVSGMVDIQLYAEDVQTVNSVQTVVMKWQSFPAQIEIVSDVSPTTPAVLSNPTVLEQYLSSYQTLKTATETSEGNALTYKTAAETAKTAAELAETSAETAATSAGNSAVSAATSEQTAISKAAEALASAIAAAGSESAAAQALSDLLAMMGVDLATLTGGKLTLSQLPAIAITNPFTVASEAAMLALDAQTGDIAIRTDISDTFVLATDDPTTLANWVKLLKPTSYADNAGHAATADNATNADAINNHRLVHFDTITELEAATKVSGTIYYAPYNQE